PEGAESYEANAAAKALHYSAASGFPALADDSGIEVAALEGAPGVLSARFGGEGLDDADRNGLLMEALRDVPDDRRQARYVAAVALAAGGKIVGTFRGEAAGRILREPRGKNGFGYDPLFYYPDLHLTFAQMLPAVKRQVSHRGRALALAVRALRLNPGLLA
ncbi:MAG TPA: non-canonical purine NTP pyrophosphatase, partial [Candidatus Polarisedimenticolia bacterium]|nr:non-canonical purine NTP pyrophosphatase [Candidatus Polarisedimenticolia bacterium]